MARPPLHERLYRALLSLFPSEFRGDFGAAMTADFRDQRRDAEGRPRELRRLWARTIIDLVRRAPREHLDVLWRDVVYACRVLRKHPVASATAILSLAVGIGLNSAIYSVVSGVLWRSLPFDESERLVNVGIVTASFPRPGQITDKLLLDVMARAKTLQGVSGAAIHGITIVAPGEPAQSTCLAMTDGVFDALRVRPVLGRAFTRADYDAARALQVDPGRRVTPPIVILGDRLWRTRFAANPNVVGTYMTVAGGQRLEIVGVMGPELEALSRAMPGQCWLPDTADAAIGLWRPRIVIGRLAQGRSLTEANAELDVIGRTLESDPFTKEPRALRAMGVLDNIVGQVRTQLLFLFGAVVCVLLVTCANIVNLFLAHAAGRRHELATRVALGASRLRLIRQSLTESLVISLLGGGIGGFLLAVWALPALLTLAPARIPRLQEITVDWSTFAFALLVSIAVGLICGALSALPTRADPRAIFGSVQAASSPRASRMRQGVTVCEIALALRLAVAATLMVRTLGALNAIELGFDPRAVVSADLSTMKEGLREAQDVDTTIIERVKALPGVQSAGIGLGPLGGGMGIGGLTLPGDSREFNLIGVDAVSPGYFEALGARLLAGRFFEPHDAVRDGRMVILVNESAAHTFWNTADPLGTTVWNGKTQEMHVIGVVADIRGSSLEKDPGPVIYLLSNQTPNFHAGSMLIRVAGDPDTLVPAIRDIIRSINREQPFSGVKPLQQRLNEAMAPRLFVLRLIGLFSTLGLLLAVVGVYGVLAEFVTQRVPEIGVRMAFGATRSDVLTLIFGHGARLVAIGLVIGVAGAVLLRSVMSTMVYGVRTSDPLAYVAACLVLVVATIAACALPARRAARLDPAAALRSE